MPQIKSQALKYQRLSSRHQSPALANNLLAQAKPLWLLALAQSVAPLAPLQAQAQALPSKS
jgi:hypothetical protein